MKYASLAEEKKLWKKGYKLVACLDEAGRGPLAGPVVAGAVAIDCGRSDLLGRSDLKNIRDSKQLSPKQREEFYDLITKDKNIRWGVGIVSEKIIDKINILEATKLAMKKAIRNLEKKFLEVRPPREVGPHRIDFLILDGKMEIDSSIPQKSIVKADEKVFSCAAASIIAKVTRDRIMQKYHKRYPQYRFNLHKGYGTEMHYRLIKKYGPCKIHRKSFALEWLQGLMF